MDSWCATDTAIHTSYVRSIKFMDSRLTTAAMDLSSTYAYYDKIVASFLQVIQIVLVTKQLKTNYYLVLPRY